MAVLEKFGSIDINKPTIGYCQTGSRSTLTCLELRLLGFKDPANWDESWRVYASDLAANRPGEAQNGEKWYNFDNGNKDLKDLKKMVKELEEVIVALREKKE